MDDRLLWEILVPATDHEGKKFPIPYHNIWDNAVREMTGGITIMAKSRGEWVSDSGTLFKERMIPVRVWSNRGDMEKIARITLDHYDQLAVLYYLISSEVTLLKRQE